MEKCGHQKARGGVLPIMAYTGRLCPKGVPFSGFRYKLVRQSQIVQSAMQDCKYILSHLLPVCNLSVQGIKTTYNYCLSRRFSILLWCFTLNSVYFKFIDTLN